MWNARSVVNKLHFLQSLIYCKSLDVFCITETWLTDFVVNNEIAPENYTIYRRDRGSRGGGVMIAVSNTIPSKLHFSSTSLELISVEL